MSRAALGSHASCNFSLPLTEYAGDLITARKLKQLETEISDLPASMHATMRELTVLFLKCPEEKRAALLEELKRDYGN